MTCACCMRLLRRCETVKRRCSCIRGLSETIWMQFKKDSPNCCESRCRWLFQFCFNLPAYFHLHLGIELRVLCKDATAGGMVLHILEIL